MSRVRVARRDDIAMGAGAGLVAPQKAYDDAFNRVLGGNKQQG
jgi:hypothetical protein